SRSTLPPLPFPLPPPPPSPAPRPLLFFPPPRHYATGNPIAVTMDNGRITAVGPSTDHARQWVAPAFFDPQINGCLGIGFNSANLTPEQVRTVADACRQHGIGAFCPTLITGGFEPLRHGVVTLSRAIESDTQLARQMPAVHLAGPYLSAHDAPPAAPPHAH